MPLVNGSDKVGRFYRYGSKGHKYYYTPHDAAGRLAAKKLALSQAIAIAYRTEGEKPKKVKAYLTKHLAH